MNLKKNSSKLITTNKMLFNDGDDGDDWDDEDDGEDVFFTKKGTLLAMI